MLSKQTSVGCEWGTPDVSVSHPSSNRLFRNTNRLLASGRFFRPPNQCSTGHLVLPLLGVGGLRVFELFRARTPDDVREFSQILKPPTKKWSERQDSNLRRLAPKASALARLSYAPTAAIMIARKTGGATPNLPCRNHQKTNTELQRTAHCQCSIRLSDSRLLRLAASCFP